LEPHGAAWRAAQRRVDDVDPGCDAIDEIGTADEIGDEGVGGAIIDFLRRRYLH
jgi:hypothetical protein